MDTPGETPREPSEGRKAVKPDLPVAPPGPRLASARQPLSMAHRMRYAGLLISLFLIVLGARNTVGGLAMVHRAWQPPVDIASAEKELAEAKSRYRETFGLDPSMTPEIQLPPWVRKTDEWRHRESSARNQVWDLEMWLRIKQGDEKARQNAVRQKPRGYFYIVGGALFLILGALTAYRLWKWDPNMDTRAAQR